VRVYPSSKYPGSKHGNRNGISFYIRFNVVEDPGQFEIVDTIDNGLKGQNHTFFSETTTKRGSTIMYDTIPFEMLKTYIEEPHLSVKVKGMTALCNKMDCGLRYVEPVG